jgi:site-specific DNA-methyltransferase (adenine-specific)
MQPYYEEPGITIYHGDCREVLPHLSVIGLLLTDPPYPYDENLLGWEIPDVPAILESVPAVTKIAFWPPLMDRPFRQLTAEHIWHKPNGRSVHHYERILVSGVASARCRVYRIAAILPNYCQYASECEDHPTQKPLKLLLHLITEHASSPICDPFMGSGTTLRAAKDLGREAIGIEIEERYCEMAVKRLRQGVLPLGAD